MIEFLREFVRHPKWAWENRRAIRKENIWFDMENGKVMYRGGEYCLDCRKPVIGRLFCVSCASNQGLIVPEPNLGAIKQGQAKWNKAVTDMEET